MNTKHTPGPWRVGKPHSMGQPQLEISSDANIFWIAGVGAPDEDKQTADANAALIAAAPRIKVALEDLLIAVNDSLVKAEPKVITAMQEAHAAIEEATK